MGHVRTLLARELAAYFLGPMAYLVLLAFQLIAALNFWELVDILRLYMPILVPAEIPLKSIEADWKKRALP